MDAVTVELETGEIRTGTRDFLTGDVTLPGLEVVRSGQLVRLDGEIMRVAWSGHLSLEGPTLIGLAEPELPPPNPQR